MIISHLKTLPFAFLPNLLDSSRAEDCGYHRQTSMHWTPGLCQVHKIPFDQHDSSMVWGLLWVSPLNQWRNKIQRVYQSSCCWSQSWDVMASQSLQSPHCATRTWSVSRWMFSTQWTLQCLGNQRALAVGICLRGNVTAMSVLQIQHCSQARVPGFRKAKLTSCLSPSNPSIGCEQWPPLRNRRQVDLAGVILSDCSEMILFVSPLKFVLAYKLGAVGETSYFTALTGKCHFPSKQR